MKNYKTMATLGILGFAVLVCGSILTLVGIANFTTFSHVRLFNGAVADTPVGLFMFFLGIGIACLGSILWGIGISKTWSDNLPDKVHAGFRCFAVAPIATGIFAILAGFGTGRTGMVSLFGWMVEFKYYLMMFGGVFLVIGGIIWTLAFLRCEKRTCILFRGESKRAKFFRDNRSEFGKISWESPKSALKKSVVVIVVLLVTTAIIFGLDYAFVHLINLLPQISV